MLFKLSTRVRGAGMVGQMSKLINDAFEVIAETAGKTRTAFLIIDEGDSLTSSRAHGQSHHEDKVAVNTLIQKIDDLRRYGGRILVILCTNRLEALDPAVLRRALVIEQFDRPSAEERRAVLEQDLAGTGIKPETIEKLVALTGAADDRPGFTFSDLRTRLLPGAVAKAFPDRRLTDDDLITVAEDLAPTPTMAGDGDG